MDDFIVWDERFKKFLDDTGRLAINAKGNLIAISNPLLNISYLKAYRPIGKTDIEGNKIYADSSILKIVDCGNAIYKVTWNNESLKYQIERINPDVGDWLIGDFEEFDSEDLTIIGTLQENPELLEIK